MRVSTKQRIHMITTVDIIYVTTVTNGGNGVAGVVGVVGAAVVGAVYAGETCFLDSAGVTGVSSYLHQQNAHVHDL